MNGRNEENLKELFKKFIGAELSEQAVEDIRQGEQILRSHTAPEPDSELIADIKAEITANLLHKEKNTFRKMLSKTTAVAAGFILLAFIGVKFFEKNQAEPERLVADSTLPEAVWQSECLADDSADSAALLTEVEQIENDLLALQFGENGDNGYEAVTEMEMELTEINVDFWKG